MRSSYDDDRTSTRPALMPVTEIHYHDYETITRNYHEYHELPYSRMTITFCITFTLEHILETSLLDLFAFMIAMTMIIVSTDF